MLRKRLKIFSRNERVSYIKDTMMIFSSLFTLYNSICKIKGLGFVNKDDIATLIYDFDLINGIKSDTIPELYVIIK